MFATQFTRICTQNSNTHSPRSIRWKFFKKTILIKLMKLFIHKRMKWIFFFFNIIFNRRCHKCESCFTKNCVNNTSGFVIKCRKWRLVWKKNWNKIDVMRSKIRINKRCYIRAYQKVECNHFTSHQTMCVHDVAYGLLYCT